MAETAQGKDLAATFSGTWIPGHRPPAREVCPHCGENLMRVGIHRIAYVFDVCACGKPEYEHLVEQMWHRECLMKQGPQP